MHVLCTTSVAQLKVHVRASFKHQSRREGKVLGRGLFVPDIFVVSPKHKRILKLNLRRTTECILGRRITYWLLWDQTGRRRPKEPPPIGYTPLCNSSTGDTVLTVDAYPDIMFSSWLSLGRDPSTSPVKHKFSMPCLLLITRAKRTRYLFRITQSSLCRAIMLSKPSRFVVWEVHIYYILFGTLFLQPTNFWP